MNFRYAAERYPALSFRPKHYSQFLPAVSDIKFHEPSRKLLLACTSRDRGIGISQMEPKSQTPSNDRPSWVLEGELSLSFPPAHPQPLNPPFLPRRSKPPLHLGQIHPHPRHRHPRPLPRPLRLPPYVKSLPFMSGELPRALSTPPDTPQQETHS